MIETDHQTFLSLECHGGSQTLFSKIIKRRLGPKMLPEPDKIFETVIYKISFTSRLQSFSWLWLVDLEIWSLKNLMNIYLMYMTSQESHFLCPYFLNFALILASSKLCNSRTTDKILRNGKRQSSHFLCSVS